MWMQKTGNCDILFISQGWTPLHFASENASIETAKFLIKAGADVNAEER